MTASRTRVGTVVAFDEHAGHGLVGTDDARTGALFFHCTAITDGTRRIDVGADVAFDVVPGHLGRWEAADVRPR